MQKRNKIKIIGINPRRFDRSQIKFYLYLLPIVFITALPIIFIFFNAFKPLDELLVYPPKFITLRPTLQNFRNLAATSANKSIPMSRYLFNSILSTMSVVLLTLTITVMAAYCMSKRKYRLKNMFFNINEAALMFVPVAVAIPRYLIIFKLGLVNSFLVHIVPLVALPVGLYLIKQFIDDFPDSVVEAAKIDGASDYYILRKVIIPNITPALATVAILSFQSSWNSLEASNYYINNEALKSFSFYMTTLTANSGNANGMVGQMTGNTVAGLGIQAAAALIMFIPNLILFIILQSRVMNTMSHSGMK
ncbi:MAG: carbohydrate ABC transporter permease [Anaerolineaceae bacterium]|nr:MAG: carbohydrate ABC transporter permease [Anaerolineaceae bacterium]